jgi:hypothetical protein
MLFQLMSWAISRFALMRNSLLGIRRIGRGDVTPLLLALVFKNKFEQLH